MTALPADTPPAQTPGPWVAWYDHDEDGFVFQAGVDNADRSVNVCETTCENVVSGDRDEFNRVVRCDTELLAAAPRLLKCLADLTGVASTFACLGKECDAAARLLDDLRSAGVKI